MKNSLIIVPSPRELENEHQLELYEKVQEYFDTELKPIFDEATKTGSKIILPEIRYGHYVWEALNKVWDSKWDN